MAKPRASPEPTVAADQTKSPTARTQQTLNRSATQPAMESSWNDA